MSGLDQRASDQSPVSPVVMYPIVETRLAPTVQGVANSLATLMIFPAEPVAKPIV